MSLPIHLRLASLQDIQYLFSLVNEPTVRSASFDTRAIDLETHRRWFTSKLKDSSCFIWIGEAPGLGPVGQVRIEKMSSPEAEIHVSVATKFRGQNIAPQLIQKAIGLYSSIQPGVIVQARIRTLNAASISAFQKAGFKPATVQVPDLLLLECGREAEISR